MIDVLIADDHAILRRGLLQILSEDPGITVKDEASDGYEVLEKVRSARYDVLVLDISMPGLSGIDVLRQVRKEYPDLPVLILTIHSEDQYALRVLKGGASGYMTKDAAPDELIKAVKKVSQGKKYISENLAEKLALYIQRGPEKALHENLSEREYIVLCLIGEGKRNKEIASELNLSPKTVSTYKSRILEKMKMKTNAQLISYVIQKKLT